MPATHIITDVIPQGMTPISAVSSNGLFTITGQTVTWNPTTDPMAMLTITVGVDVGASARGTITNTAESDHGPSDDATTDPEALPTELPNIAIDKASTVSGNVIDYTITVTNTGSAEGTYIITDTFPTGYMATCEGEMVQEFNVTELIPAGETRTYSCSIEYNPEISVMKTVDPGLIQSGDTVTYTIVLENVGDVPLLNITANDPMLPACSGTNIGDTNFGGGAFGLLPGGMVTCTAAMPQTASVINTVMVDADLTIFNSAQGYLVETGALVADTVSDIMATDDADSAVVTIVDMPDPDQTATLSIRKQVVEGSGTIPADQAFTFNVPTVIDPSGQITLMGGEQVTFTVPATATYVITEQFVSDNWTQTEAACYGAETEPATSFNIVPDEVVTCVFTNQYDDPPSELTGMLSIRKQVDNTAGNAPDQQFTFAVPTAVDPSGQIMLGGGDQVTFTVPATATYSIAEILPTNWSQTEATCYGVDTEPATNFTIAPDEVVTCIFTNLYTEPTATPTPDPTTPTPTPDPTTPTPTPTLVPGAISGNILHDPDNVPNNGDENGIPGVTVNLLDTDGNIVATTTTNSDGFYAFAGLAVGDYVVQIDETSLPDDKANTNTDPIPATISTFNPYTEVDDLLYSPDPLPEPALGSVSDIVFHDINGNGVQDPGEPSLSGVAVTLTAPDGTTTVVNTNANGEYTFPDLPPGDYSVTIDPSTLPGAKKLADNTADPNGGGDSTTIVSIDGNDVTDIPFGYQAPEIFGSIGNFIYSLGPDGNIPLAEVTVLLIQDGAIISTTETAADGTYLFDNLPLGDYTITVDTTTLPTEKQGRPPAYSSDNGNDNSTNVTLSVANQNDGEQDFAYGSPTAVTLSTATATHTTSLSIVVVLTLLIATAVVSRLRVERQRA